MQTLFTSGMITGECERIARIMGAPAFVSVGTNSNGSGWYASVYPKGLLGRCPADHMHGTDLAELLFQAEEAAHRFAHSSTAADREWASWFPASGDDARSAA